MPDPIDLFVRWELGLCDGEDEAALAAVLRDPVQRRLFVRQASIAAVLAGTRSEASMAPVRWPWRRSRHRSVRANRRSRIWLAAASLLFALGLIAVWSGHRGAGGSDAARLLAAGVGTQVEGVDGTLRSARAGAVLGRGETVIAAGGQAIVELAQAAARFELDAGTRLRLPPPGSVDGPVRLDLTQGRLRAEVAKRRADAPLSIVSPQGSAEVVGTAFSLAVAGGSTRLEVTSGGVRLSGADGQGLLLGPGQAGLAADGVVGSAPLSVDLDRPSPPGSRELWRAATGDATGWDGAIDELVGGRAWRSVPERPHDRWAFAIVRSPLRPNGWKVEAGTWLSFRYWASGFGPEHELGIHLKPADESNFAAIVSPVVNDGWQLVRLRVDRDFHHRLRQHEEPAIGESIHGLVWIGQRVDGAPIPAARFWISDARIVVGE